jgi:hypothetical protein
MPDVTISGLPNATTPLSGTERVPMDQAGTTRDGSTQDIANLAAPAIAAAVTAHAAAADPHPNYLLASELPSIAGTDLGYTPSTRALTSSTGADVILPEVTPDAAGLMSSALAIKLTEIEALADRTDQANVLAALSGATVDNVILNDSLVTATALTDGATPAIDATAAPIRTWTLGANGRTPSISWGSTTAARALTLLINGNGFDTINWATIAPTWVGSVPAISPSGVTAVSFLRVGGVTYGFGPPQSVAEVNLSYNAGTRTIINDAGDDAALPLVVEDGAAGLMSGAQAGKLADIEANADVTDVANVAAAGAMITVPHGTTASRARPAGALACYWIGSATPSNAANGDMWLGATLQVRAAGTWVVASAAVPPFVGSVNVTGGGTFADGASVTLTAAISGTATDVTWTWQVPAGSGITPPTTNTITFNASAARSGTFTATAASAEATDDPVSGSASVALAGTIGTVSVAGGGSYGTGAAVTLTASRSGSASDIVWSWAVPVGSGITPSTTNVQTFNASEVRSGTFTATATSPTALDSPQNGSASVTHVATAPAPTLYLPLRTDLLDVSANGFLTTSVVPPLIEASFGDGGSAGTPPLGAGAATFSGSQFLEFADNPLLDPGTEDFFISAWVALGSGFPTDYPAFVSKGAYQSSAGTWVMYYNQANVNGMNFAFGNPWVEGTLLTGADPVVGFGGGFVWKRIYLDRVGNTMNLWTLSVGAAPSLRASLDVTGRDFTSSHVLRIGNDLTGNFWAGAMQDFVYCKGATLTSGQLSSLRTVSYATLLNP